jgi:tetratricopeptide (TPR) repeat protein
LRESEDYLRTSIRVDPQNGYYSDLGALYTHMGWYDEAKKNLEEALEINRDDLRAHIELGNSISKPTKLRKLFGSFAER